VGKCKPFLPPTGAVSEYIGFLASNSGLMHTDTAWTSLYRNSVKQSTAQLSTQG